MRSWFGMVAVVFGLVGLIAAPAVRPIDLVKATADKIISLLNDPKLQGPSNKTARNNQIRQELDERFDWSAICRGCLGQHWTKLSSDKRTEFVGLFKQFLERTYLDRIEPYYQDLDRIEYQGERIIDNYASVKSVVSTKQKIDHPVEYRLERSAAGQWRVYDIIIEGVSLVKNYRTQFDEIIAKSGYDALIKDLRGKAEANKG